MESKKTVTKPLTAQERAESLAMWQQMYEREDDIELEMLDRLIARKQSHLKEQELQGTTGTATT